MPLVSPRPEFLLLRTNHVEVPARGLIIFDGDCGFCQASLGALSRHTRWRPDQTPWQLLELSRYGLTTEQCQHQVYFVAPGGGVYGGAAAVATVLRHSSAPWPLAGVVIGLPLVRHLAAWVYRRVAANRSRLPGGGGTCALPPPAPKADGETSTQR